MGSYAPRVVAKWTFASGYQTIAEMKRRGENFRAAVRSSSVEFDSSGSDWAGSAGDAARNLSRMHADDARITANVIEDIADQAGQLFDQLKPEAQVVKEALDEVDHSEYQLLCNDDGKVYSKLSNEEWIEKWGPSAVYKLPLKEAKEHDLTSKITAALSRIEIIDKTGFEKLNSNMEKLSRAVQEGANKLPSDKDLAEIMRKYQTKASKKSYLFPPPWLRTALKAIGMDKTPEMLTEEEIAIILSLNHGDPAAFAASVYDFYKIKERAENEAWAQFPHDVDPHNRKNLVDSGYSDAFRHTYWNALMTRRFGADFAKAYGTAHEGLGGNAPAREAMDLYNNEVGRKIAMENPNASPEELATKVRASISNGDNIVVGHDLQIHRSTADGAAHADGKGTGVPRTTGIPMPAN
ncbi:hypothetical protein [Gordonia sp. X0973]|uniref:DUF6973 domain-containing protein n=1 Tax=Gordonia sp. X0973 TaxID=2742602 RepID=UPI000F53CDFA|nr:hypothetical protein [Gordonia sp. X0973]